MAGKPTSKRKYRKMKRYASGGTTKKRGTGRGRK